MTQYIQFKYIYPPGERVRVSVKSGTVIPMPTKAEETADFKDKKNYKVMNMEMIYTVMT